MKSVRVAESFCHFTGYNVLGSFPGLRLLAGWI